MKRFEDKLKKLIEGDVVRFPTAGEREVRRKGRVDVATQVANLARDMPRMFADQEEAEKQISDKVRQVVENGECHRKKFVLPFIMKHYREGTNPIQALVWALHEYLQAGESEELNREQLRFAYKFFEDNLDAIAEAVENDILHLEDIRETAMDMDISLPSYAAQPAVHAKDNLKDLLRDIEAFRMYDGVFQHPERIWGDREVKHRDALLAENTVVGSEPFDRTNTNMPFYNNMLEKPEYFEEEKGVIFMILDMSPDEYIERCRKGFARHQDYHGDIVATREQSKVAEYARKMMAGDKFPIPVLSYESLSFSQEGLHRALAAKMAGYDKIPVLVTDNTKERKDAIRKRNKQKSGGFW